MLTQELMDPQDLLEKMFTQELIDPQDLLNHFWSDCSRNPKKNQHQYAVENLLKSFRKALHSSSKTAVAIDMNDPLDEIIRCAEEEGFVEIAQLLSI